MKDFDCEEHDQLLEKGRDLEPPRVLAEAARRVPCSPQECNADALAGEGEEQYVVSRLAEALAFYEAAYTCRPEPRWSEKPFVIACNLRQLAKAKLHWGRLPSLRRSRVLGICVRNEITEEMLNAP